MIVVSAVAAEQRLDAGGELVVVEWLAEVVIRPDPQADHAVGWVVLRGEEEDGDVGVAPELQAEADAIDRGHEHVQGHQVGMEVVERLHRLTRVGDRLDLMPGLLEDGAHEVRDIAVVVDNENPAA